MNTSTYSSSATRTALTLGDLPASVPGYARRVLRLLQRLRVGTLTLQCPDGSLLHFGDARPDPAAPTAVMHLHRWDVCKAVRQSGDIGLAESYADGGWSSPHLAELLRLCVLNRQALEDVIYGHWLGQLLYRLRHWSRRNTRANSRKNIHAHYDLGNNFYRLWLDETMNYSSAWFEGEPTRALAEAQHAKVQRALRQCGVQPGERLLEIGCGWGALAEQAVQAFDARVTGVTLSTEQLSYAQRRLQPHGSAAELRLQDYRDIDDGPYDAICSVEMVEAVGQAYWPTYFQTVHALLKSGGQACVQSIVIDDALFERYLRSTDFIQQYIFPGGCLPSPSAFRQAAEAAGLQVVDAFDFGPDYALTCRLWRERFLASRSEVQALGFDERFMRLWEFYLAYCEAGFAARSISVMQFTLLKP